MRQKIERDYYIPANEVAEAIFDFLKKRDRPLPDNSDALIVAQEPTGALSAKYYELLDFDGNN